MKGLNVAAKRVSYIRNIPTKASTKATFRTDCVKLSRKLTRTIGFDKCNAAMSVEERRVTSYGSVAALHHLLLTASAAHQCPYN